MGGLNNGPIRLRVECTATCRLALRCQIGSPVARGTHVEGMEWGCILRRTQVECSGVECMRAAARDFGQSREVEGDRPVRYSASYSRSDVAAVVVLYILPRALSVLRSLKSGHHKVPALRLRMAGLLCSGGLRTQLKLVRQSYHTSRS